MELENRKSSSYNRRQELLKEHQAPTMSEITNNLGVVLADIIFEEATEDQKEGLGLANPLQGAVGALWVSPSDLLIGRVCLKPPLTQKRIQALTHQGIMEIGSRIEQKYWNEMLLEKKHAVEDEGVRLRRIFEIEKDKLVKELQHDIHGRHIIELETMRLTFENKINQLITECHIQVVALETELAANANSLNIFWEEKMQETVKFTVKELTDEFLEKMRLQEQVIVKAFEKKINNLNAKHKCSLDLEKVKCKEITLQLRHNLECQNIANLMYVLCKERKKCKGEKQALEDYYLNEIEKYKRIIRAKKGTIRRLTSIKNKRGKQLATRERILVEILSQFQKFIYYALQASPTQGEFLLNIEKLIKFEVDDYCIQEKKKVEKALVTPQSVLEEQKIVEDISTYLETQVKEEEDEEEFEESDVLPAFFLDEKMYVREDFRDRFTAGIGIDYHHPLWNQDVEELLNIFKKVMGEKRFEIPSSSSCKLKSQPSSVHFNQEAEQLSEEFVGSEHEIVIKPAQNVETLSEKLSVIQKISSIESEEKEIRKVSMQDWPEVKIMTEKPEKKSKKTKQVKERVLPVKDSGGSLIKHQTEDIRPKFATTQSKLTLARDSVILHISSVEKKSLHNISKAASEKMQAKDDEEKKSTTSKDDEVIQQSIDPDGSEEMEQSHLGSENSLKKTPVKQQTSKLVLAQDSLELVKSNVHIYGSTDDVPVKKDSKENKKSQLTFLDEVTGKRKMPVATKRFRRPTQYVYAQRRSVSKPRQSVAKVVGTKVSTEEKKTEGEFTEERIKSLVNLMKENPSLIRLFTACSK